MAVQTAQEHPRFDRQISRELDEGLRLAKELFQVVPGSPVELRQNGAGHVRLLSNLGHLTVDALMDPNVFHNVDTGLRLYIAASGKLPRAPSGGWWVVTNPHDSG